MKKNYTTKRLLAVGFILLVSILPGCTNLDETVYSEIQSDNFYNNKLEVYEAAMYPYTFMSTVFTWNTEDCYFYNAEMSADQLAWPTKGVHGYDGGDHIRQHYHTWTTSDDRVEVMWNVLFRLAGYCNSVMADLDEIKPEDVDMTEDEMSSLIAELAMVRAFAHMKLMDMFGNVPITTDVSSVNVPTQDRVDVFEWVESQMLANVDLLQETSANMIGRVTKTVAYAMLSELYLNAEEWSGTARWDDCITYTELAMSGSGGTLNAAYELDDDISGPFNNTNHLSPEVIFSIPYEYGEYAKNWSGIFFGFANMKAALDVTYSGYNAFVVIPTAFDAFEETDLRKSDWFLFGPQYEYGTTTPILGTVEYAGEDFVYVNNIRRNSEGQTDEGSMADGEENSGARHNKYKSGTSSDENYLCTDFVFYRLTEMYFNKAEALMRQNGNAATAVAVELINESKKRYFEDADWVPYTTSSLTMDELLAERGREFIFEGKRRTDLVRFDQFTKGTWWDKEPEADDHTKLYPVPAVQISGNPNLVQNPGY